MTDWRELPAGRELDRVVAERLGWTVRQTPIAPSLPGYQLITPQGNVHTVGDRSTEGRAWSGVPRYSTDIGAALGLIPDDVVIRMTRSGVAWEASLYVEDRGYTRLGPRDNPAYAVTRAWLAYTEAQADD